MADPIEKPQSEPAGDAPSGAVSPEAQCCANVASFEGSPSATKVYGLDPKTCMAANGGGEYWASGSVSGSAPSDKRTRDGARWASVGVGMETELEITFDDESAAGCIANSTFHMEPAHIASIVTTTVSARSAQFRIEGQVEGDATLVVRCNGEDKGWFHVACLEPKVRRLETGLILTTRTKEVAYDLAGMESYFNALFRQAQISVEMLDLGVIDLTGNPAIELAERAFYYSNHALTGRSDLFAPIDPIDPSGPNHFGAVVGPLIDQAMGAKQGEERLMRYVPKAPYSSLLNGVVQDIGLGPGLPTKPVHLHAGRLIFGTLFRPHRVTKLENIG